MTNSMLIISPGPGLTTKQISTSYAKCAGTSLVMFDSVKVPVENLLGKENKGFFCIMANFNHERWFIVAQLQGAMRTVRMTMFNH
jgi:alkylation response protein AidB-like acyl-CoA dehydrogenase